MPKAETSRKKATGSQKDNINKINRKPTKEIDSNSDDEDLNIENDPLEPKNASNKKKPIAWIHTTTCQ